MSTTTEQQLDQLLLIRRVEEFLYHEATLLDNWQLKEWLTLLTPDIHYFMPILRNSDNPQPLNAATRAGQDISWFDEGLQTLTQRVQQILTGVHWAEQPRSRTSRLVTNVQVTKTLTNGHLKVTSQLLLYRNRGEEEVDIFAASREDELVPDGGGFQLCDRKILLKQSVLLAKNLTLFF